MTLLVAQARKNLEFEASSDLYTGFEASVEGWLSTYGLSQKSFEKMTVEELAKRICAGAYNHCAWDAAGVPWLDELNELLKPGMKTACGGYAYVMRAILEYFGVRTRNRDFMNIPQQGNHTAVEVEIEDDHWAFFDPTFGCFFTEDGSFESPALSLRQVSVDLYGKDLHDFVVQARTIDPSMTDQPLDQLYGEKFAHELMEITNYQKAEATLESDAGAVLALHFPIDLGEGEFSVGDMESDDVQALSQEFLRFTNERLNDDDPWNDTSFNVSQLYNNKHYQKLTVFKLQNLNIGEHYSIQFRFFNKYTVPQRLQIGNIGFGVTAISATSIEIEPGLNSYTERFVARQREADLFLRHMGQGARVDMLALRVEPSSLPRSA